MTDRRESVLIVGANRIDRLAIPLSKTGKDYHVLRKDQRGFYWYILALVDAIRICRTADCVAILSMGTRAVGVTSLIVGAVTKRPVFIRLGGDIWTTHPRRLMEARDQKKPLQFLKYWAICKTDTAIVQRCDGVIVVSKNLARRVSSVAEIEGSRIGIVHPHVASASSLERGTKENQSRNRNIVCVTNLDYEDKARGVKDCLDSLAPLLKEEQEVGVIIAGGGRYLPTVREFVAREHADIGSQIEVLGHVEAVGRVYERGDVFAYVSYVDSFPNVVLEAGASELPRVISGTSACKEQIEDGETGFVIDPFDAREFRNRVEMLLSDAVRAEQIAKAGRRDVEERYRPERIGGNLVRAIESLMGD